MRPCDSSVHGFPVNAPDHATTTVLRASLAVNGGLTAVDAAWERLLGWGVNDLCDALFIERVHPDDYETVIGAIHGAYTGETTVSFSCRYAHKEGGYLRVTWTASPRPGQLELDLVGRLAPPDAFLPP